MRPTACGPAAGLAALLLVAHPCWSDSEFALHPVVGASVGFPIGVNAVAGLESARLGARVSGAYWGRDLSGLELEVYAPFYRTSHAQASVHAVVGTNRWDDWFEAAPVELTTYAGIGARVEWRGLFLSQGPAYRLNTEHAPQGIGHRSRFIWRMVAGYALTFR